MASDPLAEIRDSLSATRLRSYKSQSADSDEQALAYYLWNVALSEALLPTLHHYEVALRNASDRAMSARFGGAWYDRPGLLAPRAIDSVRRAKRAIQQRGKRASKGRVLAELMLGFWTHLYDSSGFHTAHPSLVADVIPHAPNAVKIRATFKSILHPIMQVRNRVMHHEPIHLYRSDSGKTVDDAHRDALDVIAWISPTHSSLARQTDRFADVRSNGLASAQATIAASLPS